MGIFLVAVVIAGWIFGAVMVAALVSDFRTAGSGGRAWIVLIGAIVLTLGPLGAKALERGHVSIGESVFVFTLTFGSAATLMYAVVLVASALVRFYKHCTK
jgi:hypothetical protein